MRLQEIRTEIDSIDKEIQQLLEKRLDLVRALKPYKTSLVDKEREEEILAKIESSYIREIYKSIFQSSVLMLKELSL